MNIIRDTINKKNNATINGKKQEEQNSLIHTTVNDQSFDKKNINNQSTFQKLETSLMAARDETVMNLEQTKEQMNQQLDKAKSTAMEFIKQQKEAINKWVSQRIQSAVMHALEKSRPAIKNGLKDPDMCQFVKKWVDDLVDYVWPSITEEVQYMFKMSAQQPYVEVSQPQYPCILAPVCYIRNQYVYAMIPYDKSFWKQIKSFWYWFFFAISIFPSYGVQPCFYVFIFLCIDKSDEYQLVQYILDFKKMQFITQGIINGVIGYLTYFACSNLNKNNKLNCLDNGPGAQFNFYYDAVVYVLQVFLVWIAFILLPCSKQKGKPRFKYDDEKKVNAVGGEQFKIKQESESCCCNCNLQRGGALRCLMLWDILCFIISVICFFVFISYNNIKDVKYYGNYLYYVYVFYGITSLPFLVFALGPIGNLITKSKPTAYDKYGNCIPAQDGVKIKYTKELEMDLSTFDVEEALK